MHLETREPKDGGPENVVMEVLLTVEIVKDRILQLIGQVKTREHVQHVKAVGCKRATVKVGDHTICRQYTLSCPRVCGSPGMYQSWIIVTIF